MTLDRDFDESQVNRNSKGEFASTGEGKSSDDEGSFYGTSVFVDNATLAQYNAEMKGIVTSQGTTIKEVSGHAVGRMIEREINSDTVKNILKSPDTHITPGKTARTMCYERDGMRYVVDKNRGNIVTVMYIFDC